MTTLAYNKKANFDYTLTDKYEAGMVLRGHEVKSVKTGHISLKEAFVTIHEEELYLTNANIPLYKHAGNIPNYEPTRSRKLLLRKREIRHLIGKIKEEGLTLVPIRVYTKKHLLKLEFAVGKGKKKIDKRQAIQAREEKRRIQRRFRG